MKRLSYALLCLFNLSLSLQAQWKQLGAPTGPANVSLSAAHGIFYAGISGSGSYYSSKDNGLTWDVHLSGIYRSDTPVCFAANQTMLLMGTYVGGGFAGGTIYRSLDNGQTWKKGQIRYSSGEWDSFEANVNDLIITGKDTAFAVTASVGGFGATKG